MKLKRRVSIRPTSRPDAGSTMVPVPIQEGEHVLLLGEIDNMPGKVAISNWEGTVLWPIELQDLGEVDEHLPS